MTWLHHSYEHYIQIIQLIYGNKSHHSIQRDNMSNFEDQIEYNIHRVSSYQLFIRKSRLILKLIFDLTAEVKKEKKRENGSH